MKYKYILFDWDGTLGKTLDVWLVQIDKYLRKYGVVASTDQIVKGFGDWDFPKKMGVVEYEKLNRELVLDAGSELKKVQLYKNAKKTLTSLYNSNINLALVTTSAEELVVPALNLYNLKNYFKCVLTAKDVKKHKPDPEMLFKAMEIIGAKKEETIIVGDGPKDIGAGKNAGITTVCFYPKENEKFYSETDIKSYNADYIIHELLEILDIIK